MKHPFPNLCLSENKRLKSCDECRLRNRKCTREPEGCQRCVKLKIECIYTKNSTRSKAFKELKKQLNATKSETLSPNLTDVVKPETLSPAALKPRTRRPVDRFCVDVDVKSQSKNSTTVASTTPNFSSTPNISLSPQMRSHAQPLSSPAITDAWAFRNQNLVSSSTVLSPTNTSQSTDSPFHNGKLQCMESPFMFQTANAAFEPRFALPGPSFDQAVSWLHNPQLLSGCSMPVLSTPLPPMVSQVEVRPVSAPFLTLPATASLLHSNSMGNWLVDLQPPARSESLSSSMTTQDFPGYGENEWLSVPVHGMNDILDLELLI